MYEALRAVDGDGATFKSRWPCGPQHFAPWGNADGDNTAEPSDHPDKAPMEDLWAAGFAAGRAEAALAMTQHANAMDALLRALDRLAPVPDAKLAEQLVREVRQLLAQLVGNATIDEVLLVERCAALADLAGSSPDAVLHANPDDAVLLAEAQPSLMIIADDRLPRGELLLVDGAGEAAAGPRTMLADWDAMSGDTPC